MNVIDLPEQPGLPVWAKYVPTLTDQLTARFLDAHDSHALGAQLYEAISGLSQDRYRPLTELFAVSRPDPLRLVALLVLACWDADQPADLIIDALTDDEREQVYSHAADYGDLLSEPATALTVEPIRELGLAASTPILMDPRPARHRFLVRVGERGAEVHVLLGGDTADIRQLSGPALALAATGNTLHRARPVSVRITEGTDLATWLQHELRTVVDDAD